jgi:hypothetical protein
MTEIRNIYQDTSFPYVRMSETLAWSVLSQLDSKAAYLTLLLEINRISILLQAIPT